MKKLFILIILGLSTECAAQEFYNTNFVSFYSLEYPLDKDLLTFSGCKIDSVFQIADYMNLVAQDQRERLVISMSTVKGELLVSRDYRSVIIYSDTITTMRVDFGSQRFDPEKKKFAFPKDNIDLLVNNCTLGELIVQNANLTDFEFEGNDSISWIGFISVNFSGKASLNHSSAPDTIIIENVNFSRLEGEFDLTKLKRSKKICQLIIEHTDCSKLNLDYSNFHLTFSPETTNEEKAYSYQQLLNNFKERGLLESYEKLDKEFKEFKYTKEGGLWGTIANKIDAVWWDYGYTKQLIFRNALILNFIFFLINFFVYRRLIHDVYAVQIFKQIDKEEREDQKGHHLRHLLTRSRHVFLYTGYIFWGLKLDVKNVKIKEFGLFSYVFLQYLIGVICLAYIANFVLSK